MLHYDPTCTHCSVLVLRDTAVGNYELSAYIFHVHVFKCPLCICSSSQRRIRIPTWSALGRRSLPWGLYSSLIQSTHWACPCLTMPLACFSADLRPLPDVAMTGTCTRECTEFGHSDTCWMPGQSSPSRRPKNALKLSTFVPYQDRGSQEQVGNGSPRLSEERSTKMANLRLLPTYSAFSNSSHETCKDSPMEEIPLTQTSDFQPATTPSSQTTKREIYL